MPYKDPEVRKAKDAERWRRNHPNPKKPGSWPSPRMTGMHHSEETKAKLRQTTKAAWDRGDFGEEWRRKVSEATKGRKPPPSSRAKGGTRADLGIYLRSKWEANYARYLNWLKEHGEIYKWEFEPDTFWFEGIKRGNRSYTPDFKVWERESSEPVYHEVKGWMDAQSKTKLKRMALYHPKVKIVVIGEREYRAIKRDASRLIPFWEV